MENFAHTLLGLSLAKAGLERATPLATTTLVVASNLPDIDVLPRTLLGDTSAYLEYHRGFTHSFVGLALLALILTLTLTWIDRRFRLRRDHRRRPMRPLRLFWIAYLGGLGHTFMDFTNNYGVRPLLPFSRRWFYGDIIFVVDPWIWLILGSAVVWLTTTSRGRGLFWLLVGVVLALVMALALRQTVEGMPALPTVVRAGWFVGLGVVAVGTLLGWGRQGERLARYSLLALAIYYGGMWMAHQSALRQAVNPPPGEGGLRLAAWPTPANPALWQAAAAGDDAAFTRLVHLKTHEGAWLKQPVLDARLVEALRQSHDGQVFLDFARFYSADVEESSEGYTISLRDLRFNLRLRAELDRDLNVLSAETRWF
jgi:inner membrane protein